MRAGIHFQIVGRFTARSFANACGGLLNFCSSALVEGAQTVHTLIMTLKNAALLALVGMTLVTILLIAGLITDVSGVVRGLIPAMRLLISLIWAFASLSVVVFLYAFHKAQS
jgi:hypothetical protein